MFPLLLSGRSVHVLGGGRCDDTGFFDSKLIHLAGGTATFHEDRLCEQPVSCPFPHTTLSRGAAAVTLYSSHESKSLRHVQLLATPWTKQPMDSPGQNTRVGSPSPLQGIFLTQGWNPGLPHCRILYQLSYQVSPRVTRLHLNSGFLKPTTTCL